MSESCESCRYWLDPEPGEPPILEKNGDLEIYVKIGFCRCMPPQFIGTFGEGEDASDQWSYPPMDRSGWCGQYKAAGPGERILPGMSADPSILLAGLGLSDDASLLLSRCGAVTLGDVCKLTEDTLRSRNAGLSEMKEIRANLGSRGLKLAC